MLKPRVKICCIKSTEEANLAIKYGASALGLVGPMPSGPGTIDDELISKITRNIPPPIATFLLTSETKAEAVINHHRKVQTSTIQIVDELEHKQYDLLREQLPNVKLVQVIHVLNEASVKQAMDVEKQVDAVLLDSGNPNLPIKEFGGTGRVHNWELSRKIVESIDTPVFLAGGLSHKNVKKAITAVGPFGIDLCSSVRTNGRLDEQKLALFFQTIDEMF